MENQKSLEFPSSGIDECEVAKLGIIKACLVGESEEETKIARASANRGNSQNRGSNEAMS